MKNTPRQRKKESQGAPQWMVTYSDMVTLLLTFFVLLLSMARMDSVKFNDAAGSLKGAFGVMASSNKTEITRPKVVEFAPIEDDYVTRLYQRIQTTINRLKLDQDIELVKDRGAVVLRVRDSILFDSGQSQLREEALPMLQNVAELVKPLRLNLRIEGHTDSIQVPGSEFGNWDLSVQRATAVLKALAMGKLLPLERLSAVGYGAEHPIASNETSEGQALNRRVDFVLESVGDYRDSLPYLIDARDQYPF
jgi:chemotaxis protein MotB